MLAALKEEKKVFDYVAGDLMQQGRCEQLVRQSMENLGAKGSPCLRTVLAC